LTCYDIDPKWEDWDLLQSLSGRTQLSFRVENTLLIDIEVTDLLFIDTLHTYDQLSQELKLHSPKVRRFIALHDTESFKFQGEDPSKDGLWNAVVEFIAQGNFVAKKHYPNNNGLTVLERMIF